MKYAKIENGLVTGVIVADAAFIATIEGLYVQTDIAGIDWSYANGVFTPPVVVPPALIAPLEEAKRITKLAFRNRFSAVEKITMEIASLDNPAATMSQRQQAAALRVNLADTAAALFIDLQDTDTRGGVQMLEAAGLLTAGRAVQILDAPVQPGERAA